MDKCIGHIALPREVAIANLLDKCTLLPRTETVPLREAVGRVTAQELRSRNTLPNTLTSRMDGIAVHFSDFEYGAPDTADWQEGREYVFSNTGIGIRGDYDTAIRIEEVHFDEAGRLRLSHIPAERGEFTIPVGATVREGDLLVPAGTVLTPVLMSHLATGGYARVEVVKKPVVAFIPSGNELVPAGIPVPPGKNVDSNSIMMQGKIVRWGGEPLIYPIQSDDPAQLIVTLRDAVDKADIVVINAGSSKGTDDHTVEVLESVGIILSHMLKSGPGAHTSCTITADGKPIVGLSGPAFGAECTADWFVLPLIRRYLGLPAEAPAVEAEFLGDCPASGRPMSAVLRVWLQREADGHLTATPITLLEGSQKLWMDRCNGFVTVPGTGLRRGETTRVELRYPYRFI